MVNEQIKTILNKLDGLTQENPDLVANGISIEQFINECKDNNSPLSAIVNCLLETIHEKDEEISKQNQTIANYQAQTQGIYSRLQRRPRRLSLQEEKNNKSEVSFPLLSPRVGSLAADFDRPSPRKRFGSLPSSQVSSPVPFDYSSLSSPLSINSPVGNNPNPNLDIPVLDQVLEEMAQESEIAEAQEEELNTLRQQVS